MYDVGQKIYVINGTSKTVWTRMADKKWRRRPNGPSVTDVEVMTTIKTRRCFVTHPDSNIIEGYF